MSAQHRRNRGKATRACPIWRSDKSSQRPPALDLLQVQAALVRARRVDGVDELDRPALFRVHDALHEQGRHPGLDPQVGGGLLVGEGPLNRLIGLQEIDLEVLFHDLEQRPFQQLLLADPAADLYRQVVDRENAEALRHQAVPHDPHHLRVVGVQLELFADERRRLDFGFGDGQGLGFHQRQEEFIGQADVLEAHPLDQLLVAGDEGPLPAFADQEPLLHERGQGLAHGHAVDVELGRQLVFRRDFRVGQIVLVQHPVPDGAADLVVDG